MPERAQKLAMTDPGVAARLGPVGPASLRAAALRLVEAAAPGDTGAGDRFLAAASAHNISLKHMRAAFDPTGGVLEVCLAVPSTGRTANLYTSRPRAERDLPIVAAVIHDACASLQPGILAQALIEPDDELVARAFESAGFDRIASLAFLRGPMAAAIKASRPLVHDPLPEGFTIGAWDGANDAPLIAALERSYIGTLDCPALCDLRKVGDVLASHKGVGDLDPRLWLILRHNGAPAGAALLTRCAGEPSLEIVYLGIGPEARGKGIGARLLAEGLIRAGASSTHITCAVDTANTPALRLYDRFGMRRTQLRDAFARALR